MTTSQTIPELLKTWKVRATSKGCVLTINGHEYQLGTSTGAVAFDLQRVADGWNLPEETREPLTDITGCDY